MMSKTKKSNKHIHVVDAEDKVPKFGMDSSELKDLSSALTNNNDDSSSSSSNKDIRAGRESSPDAENYSLFSRSIHPLLIPHIIENIQERLLTADSADLQLDLLSCRLVCRRWNELATTLHRKYVEDLVFGEMDKADTKRMKSFLKTMDKSERVPFQKYRFDPGFFVQKNELLFKNFLLSYSFFIVDLKLWFDNECTMRFPKRCLSTLKLDTLQYLFFGCVNYRGRSSTVNLELTYLFKSLLSASDKLTKLCFSFPPRDFKAQQVIIQKFGDIISQDVPKSVKNLKLEMRITDEQMESLTKSGLVLDTFHIDFRGSRLQNKAIFRLLDEQKSSLQEVKILDSEMQYNFEIQFPRFERLIVLEIQGGDVVPFSYREQFPVLERLILFGWENRLTIHPMFASSKTPSLSLNSLELPYKMMDESIIYSAANCFPNLRKLELTPTMQGIHVLTNVFQYMTDLKVLEITFPFIIEEELNVDSVFTGIPSEVCVEILKNGTLETANFQEIKKFPSLNNLTGLEKLIIQDHSNEIILTDVTVYFAFLRLESLKYLEIGRFKISDKYFQLLKERVSLAQSYVSDSEDGSEFSDDSSTGSPLSVDSNDSS